MAAMFERVLGIEQSNSILDLGLLADHNHDVMCSSVDVLFLCGHDASFELGWIRRTRSNFESICAVAFLFLVTYARRTKYDPPALLNR